MKSIEVKASTIEEAIEKGLAELGKNKEEVEIEIIDMGGFLKKAKIVITERQSEGQKAQEFIDRLLKKMNFDISSELEENEEKALIMLSGKDSGKIIGYRGDVLDAVQYLSSVIANSEGKRFKKIIIDCEQYRIKREKTLISLADKLADKAVERGRKVSLEPMNPFERRIIHSALQKNTNVTTESEGEEPNRFIVITPNNIKTRYNDNKDNKRPRYNDSAKDNNTRTQPKKSFGSFGSYLGNSKSGFAKDNSFVKKSGFDNLKD
ncbi:MAG: protein jag [Clostridia bacterium]|nr:protein jag [Clostridia bacterium]